MARLKQKKKAKDQPKKDEPAEDKGGKKMPPIYRKG